MALRLISLGKKKKLYEECTKIDLREIIVIYNYLNNKKVNTLLTSNKVGKCI